MKGRFLTQILQRRPWTSRGHRFLTSRYRERNPLDSALRRVALACSDTEGESDSYVQRHHLTMATLGRLALARLLHAGPTPRAFSTTPRALSQGWQQRGVIGSVSFSL